MGVGLSLGLGIVASLRKVDHQVRLPVLNEESELGLRGDAE